MLSRKKVMRFLTENAPEITLKKANEFADEIDSLVGEHIEFGNALAILSEACLSFDKNGYPPRAYEDARPAVKMALRAVSHMHGMIVCDPHKGGMGGFMDRMDKLAQDNNDG